MTVVAVLCECCEQRPATVAVRLGTACAPFLVCQSCAPVVAPVAAHAAQLDLVLS